MLISRENGSLENRVRYGIQISRLYHTRISNSHTCVSRYPQSFFRLFHKANTDDNDPVDSEILNTNKLPRLYVGQVQTEPNAIQSLEELSQRVVDQDSTISKMFYKDAIVPLSPDQSHYVTSVLRLASSGSKKGRFSYIRLFDESGEEWLGQIITDSADLVDNQRNKRRNKNNEQVMVVCQSRLNSDVPSAAPKCYCWLCVAPPKKKDRMRWMVEKTTELGCSGYLFLDTDFSESGTNMESKKKKKGADISVTFDKLQAYALEAAEQCERSSLPLFVNLGGNKARTQNDDDGIDPLKVLMEGDHPNEISITTKLEDFLSKWCEQQGNSDNSKHFKLLICRERYDTLPISEALETIRSSNTDPMHLFYMVGPEGGWSPTEEDKLNDLEAQFKDSVFNVSLGPTVLRAETAAMTAAAAHMMFLEIQEAS